MKLEAQINPNELLTVNELAVLLKVPPKTIYAWRYRRQAPPGIRIGRHLRFRRADVERWLNEHHQ